MMKALYQRYRWPLLILLVTIVLFIVLQLIKTKPQSVTVKPRAWVINTIKLKAQSNIPTMILYAKVDSTQNSILNARVSGKVTTVKVRDGDLVKQDQLLVSISKNKYRLLVKQDRATQNDLQAQFAQADIQYRAQEKALVSEKKLLDLNQKTYTRIKKLSLKQFVSKQELDQKHSELVNKQLYYQSKLDNYRILKTKIDQIKAKRAHAEAKLKIAKNDLAKCDVRALFSGRVVQLAVRAGQYVMPGNKLLIILNTNHVEVRALIPRAYVSLVMKRLANKLPLYAQADMHQQKINLRLVGLTADVKTGQIGREVIFRVQSGQKLLARGSVFPIVLGLPSEPGSYAIPVSALYGKNKIYIVKNNRLESIHVSILGEIHQLNQGMKVIVSSTKINPGEVLLVTQIPNAINGLLVKQL
jgi:multidrug resistance efflux pump